MNASLLLRGIANLAEVGDVATIFFAFERKVSVPYRETFLHKDNIL